MKLSYDRVRYDRPWAFSRPWYWYMRRTGRPMQTDPWVPRGYVKALMSDTRLRAVRPTKIDRSKNPGIGLGRHHKDV